MATVRPAAAIDPRSFGKRAPFDYGVECLPASTLLDDLRLFGATFAAGFLFVAILIG